MSPIQPNRRLSNIDASFLYMDRPNQPQHVGGVSIYDGKITRDELILSTEQRIHLVPRYRQKLAYPPFGLAHPVWEDDLSFAMANHIREVTLPPPGDDHV